MIQLHTDGSCSGNPGPGGWACLLRSGPHEKELSGWEVQTTNNRMELMAVIMGLEAIKRPSAVEVTSDSAYVVNAMVDGWLAKWQANGWKASKKPVKNKDLWLRILALTETHEVQFVKTRGHAGDADNERVDRLAVAATQMAIDHLAENPLLAASPDLSLL